jgi:hypothetical protein
LVLGSVAALPEVSPPALAPPLLLPELPAAFSPPEPAALELVWVFPAVAPPESALTVAGCSDLPHAASAISHTQAAMNRRRRDAVLAPRPTRVSWCSIHVLGLAVSGDTTCFMIINRT